MVERYLAKVNVAGSSLVSRSKTKHTPCGCVFVLRNRIQTRLEGGAASGSEHFARQISVSYHFFTEKNGTKVCGKMQQKDNRVRAERCSAKSRLPLCLIRGKAPFLSDSPLRAVCRLRDFPYFNIIYKWIIECNIVNFHKLYYSGKTAEII